MGIWNNIHQNDTPIVFRFQGRQSKPSWYPGSQFQATYLAHVCPDLPGDSRRTRMGPGRALAEDGKSLCNRSNVDSDIFRPSKVIKSCCEGWAGGIYIYYIALIILYTSKQYDTSLAWNSTETELMGSSITSRASLAEMRIFVPNISGMTSTTCRSRRVLAGQN